MKPSFFLINYALRTEDACKNGGMAVPFVTLVLDRSQWSASRPCSSNPGDTAPFIRCMGRWMGPRVGLDAL